MNFREKKNGIRESDDKKLGMRDSHEKGAGMRDQDPPLPDPDARTHDAVHAYFRGKSVEHTCISSGV